MKENLIQTLTEYTNALEQQIAALEARVARLEELAGLKEINATQEENLLPNEEIVAVPTDETDYDNLEIVLDENITETPVEETISEDQIDDNIAEEAAIEEPIIEKPTDNNSSEEVPESVTATPAAEVTHVIQTEENHIDSIAKKTTKVEPTTIVQTQAPTTISAPTVTDIRQAISLGDRFLFQRELFAGNGEQMQQTLDYLNRMDTLSEALEYLNDNFDWDKDSNTFSLFETVLKRRFN
jgi:hypothetical protein